MASLTEEGAKSSLGYCCCVVCLKNVFRHHQNLQEPNYKLIQLLFKLLERVSLSPAILRKEVGLCNDCAVIVESVTKLFHQIQYLQLQLDWNLDKVRRVMVSADMVPSRMKEFQELYNSEEMTFEDLSQLRCAIKTILKRHMATLFPKVVLYGCAKSPSSSQRRDPVSTVTSESELDSLGETADDDYNMYCTMEVDEVPRKTTNDLQTVSSSSLKQSPSQPISAQINKATVKQPVPIPPGSVKTNVQIINEVITKCSDVSVRKISEHDTNHKYQSGRRLLRRQYRCNCLMTFSSLQRLKSHKKTCKSEADKKTDPKNDEELNKMEDNVKHLDKDQMHSYGRTILNQNTVELPQISRADVKRERKSKSSLLPFKCCHCKARFGKKRQMVVHRSIFHKKGRSVGIRKISPDGVTVNDIVYKIDAKFFCSVEKCRDKFMTQLELETHAKLHGTFSCQFCPKHFEFAPHLSLHEKTHGILQSAASKGYKTKYINFNCPRCDYKTTSRNRYIHHHLETHLGLVADKISCPICHVPFHCINEQNLKMSIFKHWNVCHNSASLEAGHCFVNCNMCSAYFVTGLQLDGHKSSVHKLELNQRDKSRNKLRHMCPVPSCKKCFDSKEHLKNHQATHAQKAVCPVKVYKCKRCATVIKTSHYTTGMCCHYRYKHSNGEKVLSMSTIRTINLTADNVKLLDSFPKQNCPHEGCERKMFVSYSSLKFHQSLHGDFTCNTCDFKCNFAVTLITHELGHSAASGSGQIGRVTCTRCKMNPTDVLRHFLQSHLNIDTTEGSKCDICGASFTEMEVPFDHFVNEHDLNRLDAVESVFKCEEDTDNCRAYFLTDAQLQAHIQRIHGGNNGNWVPRPLEFRCMQCLKQFKSHSQLRNHQLSSHRLRVSGFKITSDGHTIGDLINKINANHVCSVEGCNEAFFTEEEHTKHSKLHGKFTCLICSVEKTFAPDLSLHALEHNSQSKSSTNIPEYSCCLCGFKGCKKLKYIEHYLEIHMGLSADVVRCPICRQGFYAEDSKDLERNLYSHYSAMHDLAALEKGASSVKCDACPAYFLSQIQLSQHKANVHGDKNNWKKCVDCNKTFTNYASLANHRKKVHLVYENDFQFACDVENCEEKFELKIGLELHKVFAHNNVGSATFKCLQCDKVYRTKSSFDSHVKNHGKPKPKRGPKTIPPVVCEQCGQTFRYKAQLEIHKLRHVGPDGWEFVCEICSRKFGLKASLEQHMRVHTKEKPFVCEVCGEKYAHKHNWKSHMNNKHNANLPTRQVDTTNMKSTRKGKKLGQYKAMQDSEESGQTFYKQGMNK